MGQHTSDYKGNISEMKWIGEMVGNRWEGEKSEINQKDGAMTWYSRDNQRPDAGTRAGELDIDSHSMTLHKTMSLNAALKVQMKDS